MAQSEKSVKKAKAEKKEQEGQAAQVGAAQGDLGAKQNSDGRCEDQGSQGMANMEEVWVNPKTGHCVRVLVSGPNTKDLWKFVEKEAKLRRKLAD